VPGFGPTKNGGCFMGIFWDSIHQFMVALWDLMAGWWFGT